MRPRDQDGNHTRNVRWRWREKGELPTRLDHLMTALAHFGWYASQCGGVSADQEAYLRALFTAAREQTALRERKG